MVQRGIELVMLVIASSHGMPIVPNAGWSIPRLLVVVLALVILALWLPGHSVLCA